MSGYPFLQPKPAWVATVGLLSVVVILYVAKAALLRRATRANDTVAWYSVIVLLMVPVTWALSDWENIHVYPVAHWVGTPVTVLTVAVLSYLIDAILLANTGRTRSAWWYLPELLVVLPAWAVFWTYFSFFILNWGWI